MELKGLNLNYNICLFFNSHICWFICLVAEPFAKGTCYGIQCSNISDISKKISKGLTQTSPFVFHYTQGTAISKFRSKWVHLLLWSTNALKMVVYKYLLILV